MTAAIRAFFDDATNTVTYLVSDRATGRAAIVDSVMDFDNKSGKASYKSAETVLAAARDEGLSIDWILETHAHADHLSAAPFLKAKTGARIGIGSNIVKVQKVFADMFNAGDVSRTGMEFDHLFADGETFRLGSLDIEVMHTPGHTPACITYKVGSAVFVGDTLFMPDYGTARCDFPGGDARTLYRSIRRLLSLAPETRIFLCHDYQTATRKTYQWETTVAAERAENVHVRDGIGEDEFVAMRTRRDATLATPTLLLPSIQVNIRAGNLPPAEDNGTRYLKLPVTMPE